MMIFSVTDSGIALKHSLCFFAATLLAGLPITITIIIIIHKGGGGGGSDSSKGKGGIDSSKCGGGNKRGSKSSGGDDFSKVKDPFSNDELSKIGPVTQKDLDSLKQPRTTAPSKPSKTDRVKKSDTKKPHKTNDKDGKKNDGKNQITNSKKTPPKKDCDYWDIWCKAQKLLGLASGAGAGSPILNTGNLFPSLETAPKVPLIVP